MSLPRFSATALSESAIRTFRMYPAAWILASVALVFLPLFQAQLWLNDDHEIVTIVRNFDHDGWRGIESFLLTVDFGATSRFRPVYYALRTGESLLWRDAVWCWVLVRMSIAAVFAWTVFRLVEPKAGREWGVACALATLCVPYLSGTLFRLGPSEAYAVFFVAVLLLALQRGGALGWVASSFCVAMLIGIKENFIVLFPLQLWATWMAWRAKRPLAVVLSVGLLIASAVIMGILAFKLMHSGGVDTYANSIGSGRIISGLRSLVFMPRGWVALGALTFVAWALWRSTPSRQHLVCVGGCVLVALFNIYFYGEVPDLASRYAFPFWPIIGVLTVTSGYGVPDLRACLQKHERARHYLIAIGLVVLIGGMTVNTYRAYRYAQRTQATQSAIREIVEQSRKRDAIIVNVSRVADYEAVFGLGRFLDYYQVNIPRYLVLNVSEDMLLPRDPALLSIMREMEKSGGHGYGPGSDRAGTSKNCVEAYFDERTEPVCVARVQVRY